MQETRWTRIYLLPLWYHFGQTFHEVSKVTILLNFRWCSGFPRRQGIIFLLFVEIVAEWNLRSREWVGQLGMRSLSHLQGTWWLKLLIVPLWTQPHWDEFARSSVAFFWAFTLLIITILFDQMDVRALWLICLITLFATYLDPMIVRLQRLLLSQLSYGGLFILIFDATFEPSYVLSQAIDVGQDHIFKIG